MQSLRRGIEALTSTIESLGPALDASTDARGRAIVLADHVRRLRSDASVAACLLSDGAAPLVVVLGADGKERLEWEGPIRAAMTAPESPALPAGIGPSDHGLVVLPLTWHDVEFGRIALAVPAATAETAAELTLIARFAAAHLAVANLETELIAEAARADIGELAGPLIHEFTNLLNNFSLNLMILEQGVTDPGAINVPRLRGRIEHVSAVIREVQDYKRRKAPAGQPVDVNAAVREAAALLGREFAHLLGDSTVVGLELKLTEPLRPARGTRLDLRRCLLLLFKNAVQAARVNKTRVSIETTPAEQGSEVRVIVPGLTIPVESPQKLFDTLASVCSGMSFLELATCKSVARRFGGRFSADCPTEPGLTILLEIPALPGS